MLLAIRAEVFVARTVSTSLSTTASLTGLRSPVHRRCRLFSSAAAAQLSIERAAQHDIADGFYTKNDSSRSAPSSSFDPDTFDSSFGGSFGDYPSFSNSPSDYSTYNSNPSGYSSFNSNPADEWLNSSSGDDTFSYFPTSHPPQQQHTDTSAFDPFDAGYFDRPFASQTHPSPSVFSNLQPPASTPPQFGFAPVNIVPTPNPTFNTQDFSSLAPKPQPNMNALNAESFTNAFSNTELTDDNTSQVASCVNIDITKFDEMVVDSSPRERRSRFDYSSLPRADTAQSSSFRHTATADRHAERHTEKRTTRRPQPTSSLEPSLQKQIREERKLLRQQEEKVALENALKSQGVSVSTEAEEAAAAAAAKRKAERKAERVEKSRPDACVVHLPLTTTVRGLSQLLSKKVEDVTATLSTLGYEKLCKPTHIVRQKIAQACADHCAIKSVLEARSIEDVYPRNEHTDAAKIRSPLVCVMGHVDHGKTTLIDCIRKSTLAQKEAGGITQKIGAFAVTAPNGQGLTIFDTPGHEAFSMMRARGASLVDVVILVVAADDGVMPQTVESIRMVRAANVPFVVAITKCDLRDAKPDLVRQQLMEHGIYSEGETGSDGIIIEEVSGKTGAGVSDFLSLVHMRGELEEPLAEFDGTAEAVVIESAVDKRNGILTNVLVRNGELKVGDSYVVGTEYGKVKQLRDQNNKPLKSALPSVPVSIVGTRELPDIGDTLLVVENEKKARQVSEYRKEKLMRKNHKKQAFWESEDKFAEKAVQKNFHSLLKADCKGSIEAVESFFSALEAPNDEVTMSLVKSSIGAVTEGDVAMAQSTGAIIHAFNVKVTPPAKKLAKQNGVEIRENKVIFHLMDDVTDLMTANLTPVFESKIAGRALVKKTYRSGTLAGCLVNEGSISSGDGTGFRIIREGETVHEQDHAPFKSLQRFDKVVKEVSQGVECGVDIGTAVVQIGDIIECVERIKVDRKVTSNIAEVCKNQWQTLFKSTTHSIHNSSPIASSEQNSTDISGKTTTGARDEEARRHLSNLLEEEESSGKKQMYA